jgi:hypothetical protein
VNRAESLISSRVVRHFVPATASSFILDRLPLAEHFE